MSSSPSKLYGENFRQFTDGKHVFRCPNVPRLMDEQIVFEIIKTVMGKLDIIVSTVCHNTDARDDLMRQALDTRDRCREFNYPNEISLVSAQADAMVDAWYYMLNVASKHGINLSRWFDLLHRPKFGDLIMTVAKSNADAVQEFTEGYLDIKCPTIAKLLSREQVLFLIRMVMSELDELMATVVENTVECDRLMLVALLERNKCCVFIYPDETSCIGIQADAMAAAWSAMLKIAFSHGMNLPRLFEVVHRANMAKRDPATGKFIRRESDGKVIKPDGWMPPDIEGEMTKQFAFGTWVIENENTEENTEENTDK